MKTFQYIIKDELGIHARPAGLLAKEAMKWQSKVTVDNGTKQADAKRLIALMSMGVKKDQTVTVTAEGEDEGICIEAIRRFFEENL